MSTIKVRLTLTQGMLGTKAANPELMAEYIASKHPEAIQDEEIDTLPDLDEELQKGTTVFSRDEAGNPFIWDYIIKGFFKDTQSAFQRIPGKKMAAFKKVIDGLIFPQPRRIPLVLPEGGEITFCERPLRAQTMQGERVSLARSEEVPSGTKIEFEIECLSKKLEENVIGWLEYGKFKGLGAWRNSGKGRFSYEILK